MSLVRNNTPMSRQMTECYGCGCTKAMIRFIPQYRGFRGLCPGCGSNWPES